MHTYQSFMTPSPLAYNISDTITKVKTKAPAFSLGRRTDHGKKMHDGPGPGAYETSFTFFDN